MNKHCNNLEHLIKTMLRLFWNKNLWIMTVKCVWEFSKLFKILYKKTFKRSQSKVMVLSSDAAEYPKITINIWTVAICSSLFSTPAAYQEKREQTQLSLKTNGFWGSSTTSDSINTVAITELFVLKMQHFVVLSSFFKIQQLLTCYSKFY